MIDPAPHRARPGLWAMLFGMAGAGAVWFLHTGFSETLVAQVCHRHDRAAPVPGWLMPSVHVFTVSAVLIGAAGTAIAWRNWRLARKARAADARALDIGTGRRLFLATASLLFSLLFLVGLVAAGLAVLLVSPCSAWR